MRWTALFADLEAQGDEFARVERAADVAARVRIETSRLHLVDRLCAAGPAQVRLRVIGAGSVIGTVSRVGFGWLTLAEPSGGQVLVLLRAVIDVVAPAAAVPSADRRRPSAELPRLGDALRSLCVARAAVHVRCVDSSALNGTVERVGRDFVDLRSGDPGRFVTAPGDRSVTICTRSIALVRWSG